MTNSAHIQKTRQISLVGLIIGLIGIAVSSYSLFAHVKNLIKPGGGNLCDINSTINCSAVISSSYGEFLGIPLGAYGISFFIVMCAAALLPKYAPVTKKQVAIIELGLGVIGSIVVILLAYISYFKIKAICPTCTTTHVLVLIYTAVKIVSYLKTKTLPLGKWDPEALIRFFAVSICLSIPPLAAGLMTPLMIEIFGVSTTKSDNEFDPKKVVDEYKKAKQENELKKGVFVEELTKFDAKKDFRLGNDKAKVVVQMFSDFGCPHCKQANDGILQAQQAVGRDKVLFVYKFFPLSSTCNPYVPNPGWYPYSCSLALATRCAGLQGKFWEFKEWAFLGQEMTDQERRSEFSSDGLAKKAESLGLKVKDFNECVSKKAEESGLKDDAAQAQAVDIKGTPLIYINGFMYQGPHDPNSFAQAFSTALK